MANEHEFTIARDFDAPRELVFKAFTEADRLMQWWGPTGLTMQQAHVDLRPGGLFHYRMAGPDGAEMWGKFVYREIVPPERIVFVNSFSDADANTARAPWSDSWPREVLSTVILTEHDGKTTLTMHGTPINASDAEIATFDAAGPSMDQGFKGTFDQLDHYLQGATR